MWKGATANSSDMVFGAELIATVPGGGTTPEPPTGTSQFSLPVIEALRRALQQQVDDGSLVIRKMTPAERKAVERARRLS